MKSEIDCGIVDIRQKYVHCILISDIILKHIIYKMKILRQNLVRKQIYEVYKYSTKICPLHSRIRHIFCRNYFTDGLSID